MRTVSALARTAVVAVLAALSVAGASAGVASAADDDVTWAVRTASNDLGSERTSYAYDVEPGATLDDALVVSNHGDDELRLGVYAADGYTTDSGQFDLLTTDTASTGVGAWVAADQDVVTVGPGATVEVPFTVQVPDDATPGDYAGGIVTTLTQADDAEGINVDRRLGIRIGLRVGGELAPQLTVENLHVDYEGTLAPFGHGDATITYTIHNTGNAILSAQQAATLSGPFGWFTVPVGAIAAPPQLLPGESWDVSVPVDDVTPAIRLATTATVTPVLLDASGSTTALDPVAVSAHGWAVPWALVVLVVVLVLLVVFGARAVRRSRSRRRAAEEARVAEAVAQALQERETAAP